MRRLAVATVIAAILAAPAMAASGHSHDHHSPEDHAEVATKPSCPSPCSGEERPEAVSAPAEPAAVSPDKDLKAAEPAPAEPATAVLDQAIRSSEPEPASD